MKKGTKIGIAVGAVVAIGVVVYFLTKGDDEKNNEMAGLPTFDNPYA